MGATALGLGLSAGSALADDLELRRVMLSTGGVGYFEYEATVDGDADLNLSVRLDQVNDVLKSIVVYDDQGGIGEISLPGLEPLSDVFRELPFDQSALASPVALLNALRGAEVESFGSRAIRGRIIAVEQEVQETGDGGIVYHNRLSLLTDLGIQQLVLEQSDAVRFVDPELQAAVSEALAALAENNAQDRRELSVSTSGDTQRAVRVAYVVEAPLWKGSYRLTLSDDPAATTADVQGWAVLENLSGEDWDDVDLTVVSGNPVTFRQALYTAYYVDRPEVPVEVLGRVMPPMDEGGVERPRGRIAADGVTGGIGAGTLALAPAEAAPAPSVRLLEQEADDQGYAPPPPPGQLATVTAAASTEATTQVVFRVPHPIDVASGHSLLVPIVAREIPAERLSLYQPATHPRHPLASVRLTNETETGLPPGVLTLYERSADSGIVTFVGDARLDALPLGEDRMLSFAVDQKVTIDREVRDTRRITAASIVDGVLAQTITEEQTTVYTIEGAAGEDRLVLIEHPRRSGWDLVTPAEDTVDELTPANYRLPVEVPAGETIRYEVVLQHPRLERVVLADLNLNQVLYYAENTELSPQVRQVIASLADYRAAIADAEVTLRKLEEDREEITREQGRIRDNLRAVPSGSDLHRRYLATLDDQEDQLEQLATATGEARQQLAAARQALVDYARGLNVAQ